MTAPIQHEPSAAVADACPGGGSRGRRRAGKTLVYGLLLLAGFCCLAFSAPQSWWQAPLDILLRNAAGDLVVAEVKSSARRWRGLSRLQKAKGAATYLGDAVNNAVARQGLWTLQNLRGGSTALARQIQQELGTGSSVTGILIQINEHAKRIRIRNW